MIERITDLHADDNTAAHQDEVPTQENGLPDTPDFKVENTFDDEQHDALKGRIKDAIVFAVKKFDIFEHDENTPRVDSDEAFEATYQEGLKVFAERYPQAHPRIIRDLSLMDLGMGLGEALIPVFFLWNIDKDELVTTLTTIHGEDAGIDREWADKAVKGLADHLDRCSDLMQEFKKD